MSAEDGVREYWLERGLTYDTEERLNGQFYRDQEQLFVDAVRSVKRKIDIEGESSPAKAWTGMIVDVGCGFGRVTARLAEAFPDAKLTGLDLCVGQLDSAVVRCSKYTNAIFLQHDLFSKERIHGNFDVAVCAEVLMHIPEESIQRVVRKILASSKYLIHEVDPDWGKDDQVAGHCFYHDYFAMYREMGFGVNKMFLQNQVVLTVRGNKK